MHSKSSSTAAWGEYATREPWSRRSRHRWRDKRTGANAAITSLLINDLEPEFTEDELADLVLSVAATPYDG